jgi:hypothetical protein
MRPPTRPHRHASMSALNGYWVCRPCLPLALAEALQQATTAVNPARDSNTGSGNHDMPRLSALAHLNDAPIHGLTDMRLAYCQRTSGGALALAPRTDTHSTTTLATQTPSRRPPNYVHAPPVGARWSPYIHLWLDWARIRFRFLRPSSFNTALQLVLRPHFLVRFV